MTVSKPSKPTKPTPDFPLYAHKSGRWAKKVLGKTHYFGPWREPDEALARWIAFATKLGLEAEATVMLRFVTDRFLDYKRGLKDTGEIALRTLDRYEAACSYLCDKLGPDKEIEELKPLDFEKLRSEMAKHWGPVKLANEIQIVRTIFTYAVESGLIPKPVLFGPSFKKPPAKVMRRQRMAHGPRLFEPAQVHALIENAGVNFRAMILLALNGGFGNTELAALPLAAVDVSKAWVRYARTKTGIMRRIPLWLETVEALRGVLLIRPKPLSKEDCHLFFIGQRRHNYLGNPHGSHHRIVNDMRACCQRAKVTGRSFYDFRRTFQTIAEGTGDFPAVQHIMGHAPSNSDMASIYRQRIDDQRLITVTHYVRQWLYSELGNAKVS
jgi:integrase